MKLESTLVCLVALLMLPIGRAAYADETFEIVHIKCSPTTNTVQITPFFAYNINALAKNENNDTEWRSVAEKKVLRRGDSTFYLGEGVIRAECKLAGNDIAINIKYNKPSARGQCGGNPIGFLNVTENGTSLIKGEVIHDCMKLQQTAFLFDQTSGWRRCILSERSFNAENDPKRSCTGLTK